MNPNTSKRYKRISNWLLVLAVILFFAGVAILIGHVLQQDAEMNTAAQEYEQLVDTTQTDPSAETDGTVTEFLTDSDSSTSTFQIVTEDETDKAIAPVTPVDNAGTEQTITDSNNSDESIKSRPDAYTSNVPNTEATEDSSPDMAALKAQNKDFIAWLNIPGTKIDYPVVRSDNTDYYLTHTFNGTKSSLGTLFSLDKTDYNGKNIAIYGHHITGSGQKMFKPLLSYKEQSFYADHQYIHLTTMSGERTYKVFAVINLTSSEWDPSTATFASSDEFAAFVQRAQEQALYDTGVNVGSSDCLLTLITCDRSYAGADGRLIVMAVQQ